MRVKHEAVSANILSVNVDTSCPQGGNWTHGGRTLLELVDEGSTNMTVTPIVERHPNGAVSNGIRLEFGGDTECQTLIECLRFAANELERQWQANSKTRT